MNDDSYSLSASTCPQRSLLGFSQPKRLGIVSSIGIQSARMLGKSIVYKASISQDT